MGIGETLDAAVRLYRANWKTMMLIVAVVSVPFTVIQNLAINAVQHPFVINDQTFIQNRGLAVIWLFLGLYYLLLAPILRGAVVRVVAGIYLGERTTASQSLQFALTKFAPLLVALILSGLLIALGFIALIVPGIILWIRYQFVVPAVVVEGAGGTAALGRSWRLSKGRSWPIFATLFLAGLITAVISAILAIPGLILAANGGATTTGWIIRAVFSSIAQVITTPFVSTVGVLLYFDARIRKEAFDLAVMAREVGSVGP